MTAQKPHGRSGLSVRIGIEPSASHRTEFFRFYFNKSTLAANHISVDLPQLGQGPAVCEFWETDEEVTTGIEHSIQFAETNSWLMLHLSEKLVDESISDATHRIYSRVLKEAHKRGYHDIVRTWNYMPAINSGDGDLEVYRRFAVGRAIALEELNIDATALPAATAIGSSAGTPLSITLLAGKTNLSSKKSSAVENPRIENPRQTSAFTYPREYGPRSPSFSRAVLIEESTLLISGTASILGHKSMHKSEIQNQAKETAANILALRAATTHHEKRGLPAKAPSQLRIYLRDASDYDVALFALSPLLCEPCNYVVLKGDICRRDLLLEVEAVYHLPH